MAGLKKTLFTAVLVLQLVLLVPMAWFAWHVLGPRTYVSPTAEPLAVSLPSGTFNVLYYPAKHARGVLIVATGDGGWSDQWEEPVAQHAAAAGFVVGGFDTRKFADSRGIFDQAVLASAFQAAVRATRARAALSQASPVWYAGWSTGAEWALAAGATPDRDSQLRGILAAAPGKRSRYGIARADLLGKEPQGQGSFALVDLAPGLTGLAVVQFAAQLDPMDDVSWLKTLGPRTPCRLVDLPGVAHDMNGAGPRFLAEFDMALQWTDDHPASHWTRPAGQCQRSATP